MIVTPSQPYLNTLDPEIEEAVARNLDSTSRGRLKDWTSPLIVDKDDPTSGRVQRIAEVAEWLYPTGYSWLDEAEAEAAQKIGPESIQLPYEQRKPVIYDYFNQPTISPNTDAWRYASEMLYGMVRQKLRPVNLDHAYDEMPKGTNLGLPYASADSEYRPLVLELARTIIRDGFKYEPDPCILYWRGQSRGLSEFPKQRTVWGYPHYLTLFELQLQIPLLHYLRRTMAYAAWNPPEVVNSAVTYVMQNTSQDILSVDFSRFDASIPDVVIRQVFRIMREWFVPSAHSLIDYVERAFLEIGLLTPEGILLGRNGGVPSGSGVTNLIDSLVQQFAFHYIAYVLRNEVAMHLVQGDDGVVAFKLPWSLDAITEVALQLNLTVSSDKGGVGRDRVYFLQNIHSSDYAIDGVFPGVRLINRVIGKAMSYERFKSGWSGEDDSLRWIEQFTDLRYHPKFTRAVRFLYDNDSYLKKYTLAELIDKAGGSEKVESALDLKAFPFGKLQLSQFGGSPVLLEVARLKREGLSANRRA